MLPTPCRLMIEWNVDAASSWVWNDNQKGAAMNDPKLLTRLLQKNGFLPDEDDYISEGKKVLPVDALSSAYGKFLMPDNSFFVQTLSYKGGKGKGKGGKPGMPEGRTKGKWLPSEATSFDLLIMPHPDLVNNREDGTYLLEGSNGNIRVLVTGENWESLRFNTKSMNPEYFPSSYLKPVPTDPVNKDLSKQGFSNALSFPRSTISGTLEELRICFAAPPFPRATRSQRRRIVRLASMPPLKHLT
jgi:hypothetical protein